MATSMLRTNSCKCNRTVLITIHRRQAQSLAIQNDDNNNNIAKYPPVRPKYPPGNWGRMKPKLAWFWEGQREKLAALDSASAKLQMLTEKTFKSWNFKTIDPTPDMLKYHRQMTKTQIIANKLPDVYDEVKIPDDVYETLKKILIQTLIQENEMNRQKIAKSIRHRDKGCGTKMRNTTDYHLSVLLIRSILLNLIGATCGTRLDIAESRVDYNARVSACWNRDGFKRQKLVIPSKDKKFIRQNNCMFYGEHVVEFQVRKKKPLPEFAPVIDKVCVASGRGETFSPRVLGQFMERAKREVTAGYNIGDPAVFNHLSIIFSNKESLLRMNRFGKQAKTQADIGYLMNTCFLSTLAQAHMLGFNECEELTYPFTTQTILTDGRVFTLAAYQLNTLQLWKDDSANKSQNVCWVSQTQPLYDKYENGQLTGFNDNVLKQLLQFFLIEPSNRNSENLSPNLKVWPEKTFDIPEREVLVTVEHELVYDKV